MLMNDRKIPRLVGQGDDVIPYEASRSPYTDLHARVVRIETWYHNEKQRRKVLETQQSSEIRHLRMTVYTLCTTAVVLLALVVGVELAWLTGVML